MASFFEVTDVERTDLMSLLQRPVTISIASSIPPAITSALTMAPLQATVPHLHIHLIPRYEGLWDDPRGGVRWVLPDKAAYGDEG